MSAAGLEPTATQDDGTLVVRPTFRAALAYWAKLGWINFGGPAGQIAILHSDLVERRRWIGEERFAAGLNFAMLLPGPEAQQLAAYLGWSLHGTRGALAAGILFVAPSAFLLAALSWVYVVWGELPLLTSILFGIKAVVVAIVAEAVLRLSRRALRRALHGAIAGGALVAMTLFAVPFPFVVAGAALTGLAFARGSAARKEPNDAPHADTSSWGAASDWARSGRTLACGLLLWLLPAVALGLWRGVESLHFELYRFFSLAALVTFGGAYAVLAYVAQIAPAAGWLDAATMIDGLALAESTPGPLIMVLEFVAFVAGWRRPEGMAPELSALVAAAVMLWTTFLPSLVWILAGAPHVERIASHGRARAALEGVTAAAVGVVAHLGLLLGRAVFFPPSGGGAPDLSAVALAGMALLAAVRWRWESWQLVAGGAAVGAILAAFAS